VNIILGSGNLKNIEEKSITLELDTFDVASAEDPVTAYCLLSIEDIPLPELPEIENYIKMHTEFVRSYKKGDKDFCNALGGILKQKFNGKLAEFYVNSTSRLNESNGEGNHVIVKI
jgi:hypothetical protein